VVPPDRGRVRLLPDAVAIRAVRFESNVQSALRCDSDCAGHGRTGRLGCRSRRRHRAGQWHQVSPVFVPGAGEGDPQGADPLWRAGTVPAFSKKRHERRLFLETHFCGIRRGLSPDIGTGIRRDWTICWAALSGWSRLNITNIVRKSAEQSAVVRWLKGFWVKLSRGPAKPAAERPINKEIFPDDVGPRKVAPGPAIVA